MAVSPRIVEALNRLRPGAPPTPEQYMPRGWNAMERAEALLLAGQPLHALVHGCTGVGKTTEMLQWPGALSGRVAVVYSRISTNVPYASSAAFALWGAMTSAERDGVEPAVVTALQAGAAVGPQCAERLAAIVTGSRGTPVLLVMDGADLLSEAEAGEWFGPGGAVADRRLPPAVMTAPHAWCLRSAPSDRDGDIDAVFHLPPFPVIHEDGSPNSQAIESLANGLERRLDGLDVLETPGLLQRIARQSGGVPRYAVVLLRQALLAAAGGGLVGSSHVLEAERELRQDLEQGLDGWNATRDLPTAVPLRLRVSGAVLTYEGETKRFVVWHPLLLQAT